MKGNKKEFFSDYQGKYNQETLKLMHSAPEDITVEAMREALYGYIFTKYYKAFDIPDELSMDYWEDNENLDFNFEKESFDIDEILEDDYEPCTSQEKLILKTIDSTGDGKSMETALRVIDVFQEYEYLKRVFPYSELDIEKQMVIGCTDCLKFKPNVFGVDCIYFEVGRLKLQLNREDSE